MNTAILVLSLLFVAAGVCLSSSNTENLPMETSHSLETVSKGNHKSTDSPASKKKHHLLHHHVAKTSGANEENEETKAKKSEIGVTTETTVRKQSTKMNKTVKKPIDRHLNELKSSTDLNDNGEVVKTSSVIKIVDSDPKAPDKTIEIELKTFTPPPNASAVIEVRPDLSSGDKPRFPNYSYYPKYQFPGYQYPEKANGPLNWYPGQSVIPYVPTEELLHGQSYANNPTFNSQILYQYPVIQALRNDPIDSAASKPDIIQEISTKLFKKPLKDSKSVYLVQEARSQSESHQNQPNNPIVSLIQQPKYQYDPISNSINNPSNSINSEAQYKIVVSQGNNPLNLFPNANDNQNMISVESDPGLNKPGLVKYITNSYYLKKYPKLEWVPM